MRTVDEVHRVQRLAQEGLNRSEIARLTGIPRGTVRNWLDGAVPRAAARARCPTCGHPEHDPESLPGPEYAYLLAMYLGDGCILRHPRRVWRLDITLDARYPAIVAECESAMKAVMPASRVGAARVRIGERCVAVRSYSKAWPCLIPQHGPGPKYRRPIRLTPWQEAVVDRHAERFVRGFIHSDGCRVLNRVNGKAYPRYHFSQVSDDIRRLFCRSLQGLGIEYTWNSSKEVSIARRASVARMDEFVGPKE